MPQSTPTYFDPLSTRDLTQFICERFEREKLRPLDCDLPRFEGSGLYAIYCIREGTDLYEPLISLSIPVYVGKSHTSNSAIGNSVETPESLWGRVRQHQQSIDAAHNLQLRQFGVRLLRTPDVHCDLGENGLRVGYRPVWNRILTGFGSNEQGSSTRRSARSKWDTVHTGRRRTFGSEPHDAESLRTRVREHVAWQVESHLQLPWRAQELSPSTSLTS